MNVLKVVVYHESDPVNGVVTETLIPLTKKNACKSITQKNCGSAEIVVENGITILRVTFQTAGNGKAQGLGRHPGVLARSSIDSSARRAASIDVRLPLLS